MGENIEKIFTQDSRQKKQIAHGAKHMASRTGRIGSMKMPSDYAGKDYKKNSETVSYKIDEIIQMLSQTPFLKSLILERMDLDYQHFRSALETTIDKIYEINKEVLESMLAELHDVKEELQQVKEKLEHYESGLTSKSSAVKGSPHAKSAEECKERVFERLEESEKAGIKMTSNNVLKRHPVINYYLYKQKLWNGYKEMIEEYKSRKEAAE